jgi:hypothetical protein
MADIKLFNTLFSDCSSAYSSVTVKGLRVGYPRNFWEDVGEEVGLPVLRSFCFFVSASKSRPCCMTRLQKLQL